jgi:hypothetical protein
LGVRSAARAMALTTNAQASASAAIRSLVALHPAQRAPF